MNEDDWLAEQFEAQRTRLETVARRMLGSRAEADDAVQEAWIRLSRSDAGAIENLGAWLTTVVSRVCLNMLQARRSHPEVPLSSEAAEPATTGVEADPEHEAMLADSIGLALMITLDSLTPPERVAFVLHDIFGVPFEEIAPVVSRSAPATRQLASRARRRVRRQESDPDTNRLMQAKLVDAFLAAARGGDLAELVALLAPDVVLRADATTVAIGAAAQTRGADQVAAFCQRARGAHAVLVDGAAAAIWMPGGKPRVLFTFTVAAGQITEIDLIGDPAQLSALGLARA